jgi:Lon protease-like protein
VQPTRIPLFPLEAVLFPDMRLPLHIFEPRYRQMIRHCADGGLEFGVSLAKSQGLAAIGCTAAILQILRNYPDGEMDIQTRGNTRYHLRKVYQEKAYFEAEVEYLTEVRARASEEHERELLEACERCHQLLNQGGAEPLPRAGQSLAFHIAGGLPLPLDYKQELLEIDSEAERQGNLLESLNEWLPRLAESNRIQQKARGNGHGVH